MARVTDNDPKVMQMLTQGRTSGVFQMESTGMTSVCVGLKPQSIEDLSIIVAAYRPGPDGLDSAAHRLQKRPERSSSTSTRCWSRFFP